MKLSHPAVAASLLFAVATAYGHGTETTSLSLAHPWAVMSTGGATTGVAYIKDIVNKGADAEQLMGATSPVADQVEFHDIGPKGGPRQDEKVSSLAIPAGQHVSMDAGSRYELRLIGLKQPLEANDMVPLTLQFKNAGKVDVLLHVQAPKVTEAMAKEAVPLEHAR